MKILQACQNYSAIDPDLKYRSLNPKTFSCSRIYLIKTENEFKVISADLIDRIKAFFASLFGSTYESSFAKKLQVKSVQILDRKACELEDKKGLNKIPQVPVPQRPAPVPQPAVVRAPPVPVAALNIPPAAPVANPAVPAAANPALAANPAAPVAAPQQIPTPQAPANRAADLVKLIDQQHWMTLEQKRCSKQLVQSLAAAKPGFIVPLEADVAIPNWRNIDDVAQKRKEVMDFLLLQDAVAAWSPGGGNTVYAKINANDPFDPKDAQQGVNWREGVPGKK